MKRFIIAIGLATAIFAGVYGLASSLNVSSKTLGAGNVAVASCQAGVLTVSYATSYSSTIPGYQVGITTVSGLTSTCYSMPFRATLVSAANASLGEVTGTTPASGTSFTADFTSANVPAATVTGVHLVITG